MKINVLRFYTKNIDVYHFIDERYVYKKDLETKEGS